MRTQFRNPMFDKFYLSIEIALRWEEEEEEEGEASSEARVTSIMVLTTHHTAGQIPDTGDSKNCNYLF